MAVPALPALNRAIFGKKVVNRTESILITTRTFD
jgi:hypothetical protein